MARTESQWKKGIGFISPNEDVPVLMRNTYLNFGGSTVGETGYGFRDNAGVMEVKNSGGAWAVFGAGGGISDGDKGDITVSGSGTVWTIDNEAVTFAKMQHVATNRILGRSTAGTGDIEALADNDARTIMGLATTDSPQFTAVELGHATDTTITRVSAGVIAVEGTNVQLEPIEGGFADGDKTKLDHISVTQAVDLDQMETDINALSDGMTYKGDWDASAGSFPGGGTAQTGAMYYVSVGGTVDSVSFAVGDNIVATVDNASTTTYAANWSKHDQTDAVASVNSKVGSVVLDPDDLDDTSTTNKFATAAQLSAADSAMQDLVDDTTPQLGGELDAGAHSIGFTMQTATGDGTTTVDWGNGNHMDFTFGAFNEVFTFTAPAKPGVYTMSLLQDSVGSREATFPGTVKWPAGTPPVLTTTATTGYDVMAFRFDGTNYYATSTLNFS